METKLAQRRYDLDWLRVLAFSCVFFYHCSRFFNSADWHIKNSTVSPLIDVFTNIFDLWGMAMIFAISGASIFFALHPERTVRFLRERASRLLVPLAVGILVLAPPQVYFDRLTHGQFSGSFIEFIPHFFEPANFSWNGMHLWYLVYLFAFTVVLTPLLIWLKRVSGQAALRTLSNLSTATGAIYLWTIPIALVGISVDPFGMLKASPSEAFVRLVMFPLPLVYGYLIYANEGIQQAIIRQRRISMIIAIVSSFIGILISVGMSKLGWAFNLPLFLLIMTACSLLIWSYLLTFFGYGMRYLTFNNRLLTYANQAVLPIYILHQPIILTLGFFIIPLQLPILVKFLIILCFSFGIVLACYELLVRRLEALRFLFGMKPKVEPGKPSQKELPSINLSSIR